VIETPRKDVKNLFYRLRLQTRQCSVRPFFLHSNRVSFESKIDTTSSMIFALNFAEQQTPIVSVVNVVVTVLSVLTVGDVGVLAVDWDGVVKVVGAVVVSTMPI